MHRSILRAWFSLASLVSLSGCAPHAGSPPHAAPPSPQRILASRANLLTVPSLPTYQQAAQAYRRKDYQKALTLVNALLVSSALSDEDRAFLQNQQALCQRALHPSAKTVFASAAVAAPQHPKTPSDADCGPRALALACQRLGVTASVAKLRQAAGTTAQGTSMAGLVRAAHGLGLTAEGVQVSREALADTQTPAIAWVNQNHYVTLLSLQGEGDAATATIRDPNEAADKTMPREQLLRLCGGYLLLLKR